MERPISVVLIDDHDVARRGLAAWCHESEPPIHVVTSSRQVQAAFDNEDARRADVIVLDLRLTPGRPRFDGLQRLVDAGRRVVVYTQLGSSTIAMKCIDIGAYAFVTKAEVGDHLIAAVRAAADGRPYTPPTLSGALATDSDPDRPELSIQELTALKAWFASSSKEMAASSMNVAPATIRTYIDRARTKYAAKGRPARTKSEMVQRALEDGLIDLDDLDPD